MLRAAAPATIFEKALSLDPERLGGESAGLRLAEAREGALP
jgi:hypothetical protein